MTTEAQVAANRRNAQQSTGPRTAEGKRRVARNAVTHGLDCGAVLLPGEDAAAFAQYRAAMVADHQPVGAEEQDCVERMVAAQWRIRRLWQAEAEIHGQAGQRLGFKPNAGTAVLFDLQNEKGFAYLDRKEAALTRAYERASRRLQELQDLRRKGVRHVIEEEQEAPEAAPATEAASGQERVSDAGLPAAPEGTPSDASACNPSANGNSAEQSQSGAGGGRAAA